MKPFARRLAVGVGAASVALLAWNDPAAAHGSPFSVGYDAVAGRITVSPPVYDTFAPGEQLVYDPELDRITNDGEPGWDRADSLPLNTRITMRFVQPLRYWNASVAATDPLPTPGGTIRVASTTNVAAASAAAPGGVTGVNPRFLAQFTTHHHVSWMLLEPDAPGLYGLWASLESERTCTFPAAPSDPFLVVLNYGVTSPTDYAAGVARLAATAAAAAVTVDVASGTWTQAALGHPVINLATSVTKTGVGTLVLDAPNAFVGPTRVAAGVLALATPQALARSTLIEVDERATLDVQSLTDGLGLGFGQTLGGAGTIAGSVTFGCGSTLAPGSSVTTAPPGLAVVAVPEPGTLGLAGAAVSLAAWRCRRRRLRPAPGHATRP